MTYAISYAPSAASQLRKLDKTIARRLIAAIEKLGEQPYPHGSIQLKGGHGERRLRVGSYRIIYDVIDDELIVLVLRVGHRREIYR